MDPNSEWMATLNEHRVGLVASLAIVFTAWLVISWLRSSSQTASEYRRAIKGWWGELQVRWLLRIAFFQWPQWHDVYVACERGLTQIDHVLVHRRGIFVIETKNHRADAKDEARQQNELHCEAVKHWLEPSLLDTSPSGGVHLHIESVVVLLGGHPEGGAGSNVRHGLFAAWKYLRGGVAHLSDSRVRAVSNCLEKHFRRSTDEVRTAHRAQIRHGNPPRALLRQWGYDPEALLKQPRNAASERALEDKARKQSWLERLEFLRDHRRHIERLDSIDNRAPRWSAIEERAVRELHALGVDVRAIATSAGRSDRAIEIRLGLPTQTPRDAASN